MPVVQLAALLLLLNVNWTLASMGPSCKTFNNTDFQGDDLKLGTSKSAAECCTECRFVEHAPRLLMQYPPPNSSHGPLLIPCNF